MDAPLAAHLKELRGRILTAILFFAAATLLAYPIAPDVLNMIKQDLLGEVTLIVISPQEALVTYIKVSIIIGFLVSLPVSAFHIFRFVSPGLEKQEKTPAVIVAISSLFLFACGIFFAYKVILPLTLDFLFNTAVPLTTPMYSLANTFSFILNLLIACGIAFQIPLVTAILAKVGIVSSSFLSGHRRHAIVTVFFVSAVITDPSVISQLVLAIPMIILYELGIFTAKIVEGKG